MPYTKQIPTWNAPGSQPPQSLIDNGWSFNQKPPADYFNWQWHNVYQVLTELHQYALHSEKLAAANGIATLGADSKLTAAQLPAIGSAQITDGSITNNDLANDIKVGSLATLGTTAKSTVVAAVNEVRTNLNSHTGDASIHVTPANKTAWDAKAETTTATTSANGLMSSADKTKLDGVAANANNYTHPSTHPASMIVEDSTRRFVTDTEKATWNAKASTATATTLANGLMSAADKAKLDTMTGGANNYTHPTGDGNLHVPATGTTNAGKYLKAGATAGSISWETILAGDVSGLQALLDGKAETAHGHDAATTTVAGFMAAADKVKLNGIASGANNYSHPTGDGNLHVPATSTTNNGKVLKAGSTAGSAAWGNVAYGELTGVPSTFAPSAHTHAVGDVTGLQTALDGKSDNGHSHAAATTSVAGFMAGTDKSKLDGISANANRVTNPATNGVIAIDGVNTTVYAHPTGDGNTHVPATGTTNNGKFLKAGATAGSVSWQTILAGDVSGLQALLDAKSNTDHGHSAATTAAAGFMAAADKTKLDGIATGAQTNQNAFSNVKVGATTIAADTATDTLELIAGTNITLTPNATTDAVTITNSTPAATTGAAGLMSAADKTKLDGVATGAQTNQNAFANILVGTTTVAADNPTDTVEFVAGTNISITPDATNDKVTIAATTPNATTAAAGLMSNTDKSKLDGIATGANNYVHPSTHPATMIVEDASNRFVTDTEKATWNAKASTAVATTSANGLMASTDKSKLDGIAAGANNYVHPSTHPATMIVEDTGHKFVTDAQIAAWNAKASTAVATTSANGLMAAADKVKLNGIADGATKVEKEFANGLLKINGVTETIYAHPASHDASMINETASRVFVTPSQRADIDALTTDVYDAPVWATIPLQNGWSEYATYSTPQAYLSPNGFVYVRGWIRNGSDGTVAGTLPSGYRPIKGQTFITGGTAGTKAIYRVQVGSDGTLTINQVSGTANTSLVALDGISFSTLS